MSLYDKASLVLIPSGTKTSKVYSQVPTNGDGDFTFSRSTAATRVNASGNIEKETQNTAEHSNNFNQWSNKTNASLTSGQSGYDGSSDAWLLQATAANFSYIFNNPTINTGIRTRSVYAKAGTSSNLTLLWSSFGNNVFASFDLSNGTFTNANCLADIEDVGGGWYRCISTITDASNVYAGLISLSDETGSAATIGDNIYIQDFQQEAGLVARDYIETTTTAIYGGITDNVPRLDYTDSSCPALLLEPQRTNLATQSEYFKGWNNQTNVTITSNYTTSPEGLENASRLLFTANGFIINIGGPSQSAGTQYTLSCYAKRNDSGTQNFGFFKNGSGSVDSAMSLTNEWQRFDYTYTASNDSQLGLAGISGADVSVYGFQVEEASYATSYIPTYGSAVTRNAEAALKTGVADLINDGEGSLYMEVTPTNFEGDQRFGISDNIGTNRIVLRLYNPSNLQLSCVINSSVEVSIANSGYSAGNTYKIAGAWKDNDAVIYVNGVQVATDTNCNITPSNPLTRISFDNGVGTAKWENPVSQTMYFPTRLSNEELATLTTI